MNDKLQQFFTKPVMTSAYVRCLICDVKVDSLDRYLYGHLRSLKHKKNIIFRNNLTEEVNSNG